MMEQVKERLLEAVERGQQGEVELHLDATPLNDLISDHLIVGDHVDHVVNGGLIFSVKIEPLPQYAPRLR